MIETLALFCLHRGTLVWYQMLVPTKKKLEECFPQFFVTHKWLVSDRSFIIFELHSALLILRDGAISHTQPQMASDHTIHKKLHNSQKNAQYS